MSSKIFLGKSGKLSRKHVKGAIELFEKDGFNVSKIAKIYGVNRTTMERVLIGNGVMEPSKNSCINDKMIQEANILYSVGKMSLAAIGEKLGVSRWTVKKALHLGSVKTRVEAKKGLHKRKLYNVIDETNRQRIIDDYNSGMAVTSMANKYCLPNSRLYAFLHKENVPVRKAGRKKVAK